MQRQGKVGTGECEMDLHSTNHPNNLLKELNKCRLSETMCDVTILVGSRSFAAHKAVLACAAGYFQNLFLNTGLDAARTYVVDFITPANFEKILSFVYTSELFTDLINVGVIYEVAERLGMEDLLRACHSTFPDLESSALAKQPSVATGEGFTSPLSSRNYILPGEAAGAYKEDERNPGSENTLALALLPQQPPKTEQEPEQGQFAAGSPAGSCPQYKVQSNGDYGKGGFFGADTSLDISMGSNSCPSNSDHSKEQGFGPMEELRLEDLGDEELPFEDAGEELGPTEESFKLEAAYRYHVSQHKCGGLDGRPGFGDRLRHPALPKRKLPEEFLSEEPALPNQPGNSKYSCKVCGKRFAHTSEFNYHRRIHTGEKPYQCKVCHKFFRGRSTIKCHLRTHAGALMYRCTVCGHYSSTLNLMSKHIGVHKGSLPPDFTIEQTFMYVIHSKEAEKNTDS
uniref:Zinc finger and BTB domain containing 39 n=1 Tax=Nothoprocta perdicaria TaxID=30464 RepID=A0A8C6ZJS5_NOTPE